MKILVPVKRVVDANIKVKVGPDGKLDVANLKHSIHPFDEIALEQAVQMKEKGIANEVIAVSVGDTKSQETLRTPLLWVPIRAFSFRRTSPLKQSL